MCTDCDPKHGTDRGPQIFLIVGDINISVVLGIPIVVLLAVLHLNQCKVVFLVSGPVVVIGVVRTNG